VLALQGTDVVRVPSEGGETKKLYSVNDLVKLVGAARGDPEKILVLLGNGADGYPRVGRDVDVVYDTVGGDTSERSFETLRRGGCLVTTVMPPSIEKAERYGIRASMIGVQPSGQQLREINRLIAAGRLKTHIATVLPLSEIRKAHQLSESGRTRGKIILHPS
jgi:NADPH:quinone reductase-like Zn-dependent oxidoreductase